MLVYKQDCLLFGGYDHDLGYLNDVHVFNFGRRAANLSFPFWKRIAGD
jgi:hypothetical protein